MKPDFMVRSAKIIAEIRTRTCIDTIDTEVLEEILQYELNEYYYELNECYDDKLNECYDEGYDEGYSEGKYHGYDEGKYDGYDEGYSDGHYKGKSEGINWIKLGL